MKYIGMCIIKTVCFNFGFPDWSTTTMNFDLLYIYQQKSEHGTILNSYKMSPDWDLIANIIQKHLTFLLYIITLLALSCLDRSGRLFSLARTALSPAIILSWINSLSNSAKGAKILKLTRPFAVDVDSGKFFHNHLFSKQRFVNLYFNFWLKFEQIR